MEQYIVKEEKVGKLTVKVLLDESGGEFNNPRDWDNLGTMACFHRRYTLGDKHSLSIEEVQEIAASDKYISLPLYLYDHSGITMNTSGFSCPWDSGQVGIIFVSLEKVRQEYGVKRISAKVREKVLTVLKAEVKEYDAYIRGEVYGYTVTDEDGEEIESCWGFVGEEDYCLSEGKSVAQYHIDHNPLQLDLGL